MLFTFVVGDIGGARMQLPVAKELANMGHTVNLVADGDGMSCAFFDEEKVEFLKLYTKSTFQFSEVYRIASECDLTLINTCASAHSIEESCLSYCRKPVAGADGYFNHGLPQWRNAQFDYWFAIDEGHAKAIKSSKPNLEDDQIRVVGQPAFDGIIDMIPKKDEIRSQARKELRIADDETAVIWWSQGMPEVIEEDLRMIKTAIDCLKSVAEKPVFLPRIHPKLNKTVRPGYVEEIQALVLNWCAENNVPCIESKSVAPEAATLAADLILAITSTEDIKSTMMGGPPVVHPVGYTIQKWFENDLGLKWPYLPDVISGTSLIASSTDGLQKAMQEALSEEFKQKRKRNWKPPTEKAITRVANELIKIAQN